MQGNMNILLLISFDDLLNEKLKITKFRLYFSLVITVQHDLELHISCRTVK